MDLIKDMGEESVYAPGKMILREKSRIAAFHSVSTYNLCSIEKRVFCGVLSSLFVEVQRSAGLDAGQLNNSSGLGVVRSEVI